MINYELKMHGKSLLIPLFLILPFFGDIATLERPLSTAPYEIPKNLLETIFLFRLSVYMQKIYVIWSFHQEIYISSKNLVI